MLPEQEDLGIVVVSQVSTVDRAGIGEYIGALSQGRSFKVDVFTVEALITAGRRRPPGFAQIAAAKIGRQVGLI